jgi:hypothetical protein
MPVNIPEVLNNLVQGNPELVRALLAIVPNVKQLVLSPAIVATITTAEQIFPCNGLAVGDFVHVSKPTAQAGLGIAGARVTSANNIGITFVNPTAAGITPTAAETYLILHAPGLFSGRPNFIP